MLAYEANDEGNIWHNWRTFIASMIVSMNIAYSAYEVKNNYLCLFERPFKIEKNGVFLKYLVSF